MEALIDSKWQFAGGSAIKHIMGILGARRPSSAGGALRLLLRAGNLDGPSRDPAPSWGESFPQRCTSLGHHGNPRGRVGAVDLCLQPGPLTLQPCWLVWASEEQGGQGFREKEWGARHLTMAPVSRTPGPRSTLQGPRALVRLATKTTTVAGKILIPSQLLSASPPKTEGPSKGNPERKLGALGPPHLACPRA